MASQDITPANRIRELNDISTGIAETLRHMGQAINALSPNVQEDGGSSKEARKEAFDEHSKAAYAGIQAFQAKMRRQAYALDEAGIIAAEAPTLSATNTQQQAQGGLPGRGGGPAPAPAVEPDRITNGGLGHLDVGWLNSRGNKVGVEKEAEMLQEAKALLQAGEGQKRAAGALG
ncbi:hypothetical protein B0A55_09804 [Friedmanniomyces simplex]|uniref:Mediator of RNA polymerase II transcription subunit 11 n=1 Tax=Friedmanniomyces simplex TaxID=329884 RepID=A0A4V5NDR9_9PEZI|nr:hypothetical protein B0A55_09804 [Friedmanniomyces simplex]